jgi:DNA polymerase III subunit alpha
MHVLPPDINESEEDFTVSGNSAEPAENKTIRFGLAAVKNVGHAIVEEIIRERRENGAFQSMEELLGRVRVKDLNKKSLESLLRAGAFDALGERNQFLFNIEALLKYNRERKQEAESNQTSLFADQELAAPSLRLAEAPELSNDERLGWEKELLGLYISSHPLHQYETQLAQFPRIGQISARDTGRTLIFGGIFTTSKKITTKSGEIMFFADLEDLSGKIETILFPAATKSYEKYLHTATPVRVRGRINDRDGEVKLICEDIKEL